MTFNRKTATRASLVLLLVLHFAWIASYFEPAIFSPDAHGYLLQARLLATEGRTWFAPESDLQHVGIHWYETESGRYYSHYPFGLPGLMALFYWLVGPAAALLVNAVLVSLTLLGFFLLCRTWVGELWAVVAVVVMAVNPVFNTHALNKDAHVATAFALVWGLYLLVRWSRSRSPGLAFVLGLVWGTLPTIRNPAALYGLVPAMFFLFHHRPDRRTWLSYLAADIGALLPIGTMLWHNQIAFGAFWRTGYSLTNEQTAFALSHFAQHVLPYIRGLLGEGAGLFFPLGVAGAAVLCAHRPTRRLGALVAATIVPITVLYMAYYWGVGGPGGGGGSMRFLVPTFFLYTLAGVFLLRALTEQWPRLTRAPVAALLLLHAGWALGATLQTLGRAEENGARQVAISRWIESQVEPGSLIIAQSRIQEQLGILGDWRLVDEMHIGAGPDRLPFPPRDLDSPMAVPRDLMGPMVAHRERRSRYQDLSPAQRLEQVAADLSKWADETHRIYWVVPEEQFRTRRRELGSIATFTVVDTLELPQQNLLQGRFGRMIPPGGGFPGPMRPMGRPQRGGMMGFGPMGGKLLLVEWDSL